MKPKYEFAIVVGSLEYVQNVVSGKLNTGWKLAGSISTRYDRNDLKYIQPMVKETTTER